jgi:hypothetical protein
MDHFECIAASKAAARAKIEASGLSEMVKTRAIAHFAGLREPEEGISIEIYDQLMPIDEERTRLRDSISIWIKIF